MAEDSDADVGDTLEAVLLPQSTHLSHEAESNGEGRRQLNLSAISTVAIAIVFLLLAMTFGESLMNSVTEDEFSGEWWNTPLQQRHTMELPMDTLRAQLPVNGTYEALPYTEHFIEVELPASEQDAGFPGPALMTLHFGYPMFQKKPKYRLS